MSDLVRFMIRLHTEKPSLVSSGLEEMGNEQTAA